MKRYLAAAALISLVACKQGSDNESSDSTSYDIGERPTAPSGTMDEEAATDVANQNGADIANDAFKSVDGELAKSIIGGMGKPSQSALKALKLDGATNTTCEGSITAGADTDADSDGIVDSVTKSFSCSVTEESHSLSSSGTFSMLDKDPENAYSGFTAGISDYLFSITHHTAEKDITSATRMNGNFDVTIADGVYTSTTDFGLEILINEAKVLFGKHMDVTYTPADDANDDPFDKGTINSFAGFFFVEGSAAEGSGALSLQIAGENLVRDTCESGFDSGTVSLTDGSSNVLVGTFANCGVTWTYNGEAI